MTQATQTIPAGYKQTDIGVIPMDWEVMRIGDICKIFGRIGFRGYTKQDIVNKNEGAITISPSNITDGQSNFEDCTYISWLKYNESPEIKIYNEDIIFVKTGSTVGKTSLVKNLPEKATINPQLVVFKNVKIENHFLGYVLGGKDFQDQIKKITVGGAIPTLSQKQIANLVFPQPKSKPEQIAIATALANTDALIEKLEKLIAKKKAIKQGAMQQLLTIDNGQLIMNNEKKSEKNSQLSTINYPLPRRRLPGFSGEWEVKKLGEIAEMNSGGTPSSKIKSYYGGHLLWASIADMTSVGKYISDTEKKLTNFGLANSSARIFPENTVLYAMYASIGECCIALKPIATSQAILGIRCNKQINNVFLFYYLTSIKDKVKLLGQQGTQSNLNKGMVGNFELSLPQLEEQTAIATVLSDMDAEIEKLENKLGKYRQIKTSMMQQLLTGKIRLVN